MSTSLGLWSSVNLGDVVAPLTQREVPTAQGPSAFIGMEHVQSGSGAVVNWGDRSDVVSSSPVVAVGDVLYGRLRPYLNKVAIAPVEAYVSGEFIVFRPNETLDGRFLKWRLTAQDFVDFACSLNTGDRPRVKWTQMATFRLDLPPLDEQRRIVDLLEDHFSRLDAADRAMSSAKRQTTALSERVVEEFLQSRPFERVPLSSLLNAGQSGRLVDQGWSPQCEKHPVSGSEMWGVLKTTAIQFGGFADVENKQLPSGLEPRPRIEVQNGDLLMTRAGPRSRCGVSCLVRQTRPRLMLSDKLYRLRPDADAVDPEYLAVFLASPSTRRTLDGLKTGISDSGVNLTQDRLLGVLVPLPDRHLQSALVARVQMVASQVGRLDRTSSHLAVRGATLRRSLLAAAFSGRLTTRHDPMKGAYV